MNFTKTAKTIRAAGINVAARTVKGEISWGRCCYVPGAPDMHHPVHGLERMDVDDSLQLRRDDRPRAVQSGSLQSLRGLQGRRLPLQGGQALPQNPSRPQAEQPSGPQGGSSSANRSGLEQGFAADHRDHSFSRAAVFAKTGTWAKRARFAAKAFAGLAAASADLLARLATNGWRRLMGETHLPTPRAQAVLVPTYRNANYRVLNVALGGSSVGF